MTHEKLEPFKELKTLLLELLPKYPNQIVWGKSEFYLKSGKNGVDLLHRHKIIEKLNEKEIKRLIVNTKDQEHLWYRLAPKGVDLAISMINLENSERMLKYTKNIKVLTWIMLGVSILNFLAIIFITFILPAFLQNS